MISMAAIFYFVILTFFLIKRKWQVYFYFILPGLYRLGACARTNKLKETAHRTVSYQIKMTKTSLEHYLESEVCCLDHSILCAKYDIIWRQFEQLNAFMGHTKYGVVGYQWGERGGSRIHLASSGLREKQTPCGKLAGAYLSR